MIQYDLIVTYKQKKVRCKIMACPIRIELRTATGWVRLWPGKEQFGPKTLTRAYDRYKYWLWQLHSHNKRAKELSADAVRMFVGDALVSEYESPTS